MTLGEIGEIRMCKRILKGQTSTCGDVPFYKIGTFGKTPNAFISKKLFTKASRVRKMSSAEYANFLGFKGYLKLEKFLFLQVVQLEKLLYLMDRTHIFKIAILYGLKMMKVWL
jgi:hypothetical protein